MTDTFLTTIANSLLSQAANDLRVRFQIHHTTSQFETADHDCSLAPEENV